MNMIVAVDSNWGIGYGNKLLVSIPEDMKFFRRKTMNHVIVMGRRTLESFPGGRPLKNRTNIVLTRNEDFKPDGAAVVHEIGELMAYLRENCRGQEVFCIGGESVYRQLLPYTETVYVTKIDRGYQADAYFPNLDENPDFRCAEKSEEYAYFDLTYHFLIYRRTNRPINVKEHVQIP